MSLKRPRRSLPSLPTSLTNPGGCPAEFRLDDTGRFSPLSSQTMLSPTGDMSPRSGRRSASPVRGQRRVCPNSQGLKHQPTCFGGYAGRFGMCVNAPAMIGRRLNSASSGLAGVISQHESLRRHHSSGCAYSSSASSCSLLSFVNGERAIRHQNSCPSNLGSIGKFSNSSLNHHAYRNLRSTLASSSQHLSDSHQHSSGSLQRFSSSDDTDTEVNSDSPSVHSGAYVRGAGLTHQGSIPCAHPVKKLTRGDSTDNGSSDGGSRSGTPSHHSDDSPCSPCRLRSRLARQTSLTRSLPGNLSPSQLSPASSPTSLRLESPSPTSLRSPDPVRGASGVAPSSGSQCTPHTALQRNESMVYEEDVPVIVRRRGCMLRVRITSFVDADGETSRDLATPTLVSIIDSLLALSSSTLPSSSSSS